MGVGENGGDGGEIEGKALRSHWPLFSADTIRILINFNGIIVFILVCYELFI